MDLFFQPPAVAAWEQDELFATSPDFSIDYAINGHMHEGLQRFLNNRVPICANVRQYWHQGIKDLTGATAKIRRSTHHARSPDSIFAADIAILFRNDQGEKIALMSHMRCEERRIEVVHARRALRAAGFKIVESDCFREGSGDTLYDPNYGVWWIGVGQRTAAGAGKQLSKLSDRPAIEVGTLSPHFYHLDTFLSFLPNGHVVVYKDAMAEGDYKKLCDFYPDKTKRLELTREEAMKFAANLQFVTERKEGKETHHVFAPHDCPKRVIETLQGWGYNTVTADIRGVRLAGGGFHCTYQRIWDLVRYQPKELPDLYKDLKWVSSSRVSIGHSSTSKPVKKVVERSFQRRPSQASRQPQTMRPAKANTQRNAHRPLKSLG